MGSCAYCDEKTEDFGIKICDLSVSKLYLFKEQSHRGRVIVAYSKHVSEMIELSDDERNAFFSDVARASNAVHKVFSPTKVNYGAYGDTGHHLHFHLVPKYEEDDFEWGGVFEMNPKRVFLSDDEYSEIINKIQNNL